MPYVKINKLDKGYLKFSFKRGFFTIKNFSPQGSFNYRES